MTTYLRCYVAEKNLAGNNYPVVDVDRLYNALVLYVDNGIQLRCAFLCRLLCFLLQLLLLPPQGPHEHQFQQCETVNR